MADPRKLHGTEEFLRLSLLGLPRRSSDKGLPMSASKTRFPVLWMFFLFEEKAATEER